MPERSDAMFKALVATGVDGIVVIDSDGLIQVYSGACERLFGYEPDEVIGKNVRLLMPEPYHAGHVAYPKDFEATGESEVSGAGREVVGRRKNGSLFPMYLSVGEGHLAGQRIFVWVIQDLAARQAAEDALREREARLSSILDTVPDAIIAIDERGLIESFSPAAVRLFGYEPDEVLGQNIKMLMPHPYREQHDDYLAHYRRSGEKRIIGIGRIVVGQRRNGSTFPMELSVGEAHVGERRIFTGFVRDISERQGTEQRLAELQSELLHVSRLSAMGQMSSAIAHELNQPLTAISNYVKAARRTLDRDDPLSLPRAQEMMDKAAQQVLRAGAIIRNLREFIEKRDAHRSPESLNKVVEESIALGLVGMSHFGIRVRLELEPAMSPVLIDRIQIQQVLINLIRNGIEAMQAVDRRELSISTSTDGVGYAQVTVRDSGPGLSREVQQRLFQPFVTTKEDGMGIGLNICQSIVEAHGGSIVAFAVEPSGTSFRFRLPIAKQSEEAA